MLTASKIVELLLRMCDKLDGVAPVVTDSPCANSHFYIAATFGKMVNLGCFVWNVLIHEQFHQSLSFLPFPYLL